MAEQLDAIDVLLVVASDLSQLAEGELVAEAAVGIEVVVNESPEPEAWTWEHARSALQRAGQLPWTKIEAIVGALTTSDSMETEIALYMVATGPLAGARVAFGVPYQRGEDEDLDDGFIAGKDMEQNYVRPGVLGIDIASQGDWPVRALHMSEAEHTTRVAAAGAGATYYLMSMYD